MEKIYRDPDFNSTFATWTAVLPGRGEFMTPESMSDQEIQMLQGTDLVSHELQATSLIFPIQSHLHESTWSIAQQAMQPLCMCRGLNASLLGGSSPAENFVTHESMSDQEIQMLQGTDLVSHVLDGV